MYQRLEKLLADSNMLRKYIGIGAKSFLYVGVLIVEKSCLGLLNAALPFSNKILIIKKLICLIGEKLTISLPEILFF